MTPLVELEAPLCLDYLQVLNLDDANPFPAKRVNTVIIIQLTAKLKEFKGMAAFFPFLSPTLHVIEADLSKAKSRWL